MSETALIQVDPPKILAMHRKPTRVKNGEVTGVVPGTAIVPVVKLECPKVDTRTHKVRELDPVAHADRVEIGWEVNQHENHRIVQSIKEAAGSVIFSRFSQTQQMNMLADAQMIALEKEPTAEQLARLKSYRLAYSWIQAVRAKSNELEVALVSHSKMPDFAELEVPYGD